MSLLSPVCGVQTATRGGMLHLVLNLCRQFEDAFAKCVDGGKGGGEVILQVQQKTFQHANSQLKRLSRYACHHVCLGKVAARSQLAGG